MWPLALVVIALAVSSCGCAPDDAAGSGRATTPQPAPATPTPPPEPAIEDGAIALTAEMATPYFRAGEAGEAASAFALERWAEAENGFARLAKSATDPADEARATLMLGLARAEQRKWSLAAAAFESALGGLPLLSDYLHYHAARARFFARDFKAALEHARAVSPDSIVAADAELLIGDLLRGQGTPEEVLAHYQSYRQRRPSGIRMSEVRYRIADGIEELVRAGRKPGEALGEALSLWRQITVDDPLSSWKERAQERIDKVLKNPPSVTPDSILATARAPLSADELITRGMELYGAMRNPESEADFEAALSATGIDDEKRCVAAYHRANSVFKQRNRQRAAPLFDEALAACKKTRNADLQVKAAYQAGRSYANTGDRQKAIDRYSQAETLHPEHSYADDARMRQAEEYRDLGDQKKVTELLSSIPKVYPQGDMRAEALWRLAFRAIKDDQWREAIGWLEKQVVAVPIDDNYWAEGQAQYWMGRAWAELGDPVKSVASYRETIRLYPMSYYSLLALNRLRESHKPVFDELMAKELSPTPAVEAAPMAFRPRAVYATDDFKRALELLRLGLGRDAEAELRKLGFSTPRGKDRLEDPDEIDRVWAMAWLYHLAGRYEHSHWVTRWHVLDYKRHWPRDGWRMHWDIAFPRAWWPLLDKWATKRGHPTELQISFVREESAFDPLRESFANAIGLTQMIFPTARRFAKGTGIDVSRETLRDPEKNVTIGSAFLSFLYGRFDGLVALIIPSYNAGEGATYRWLRERGSWPVDEWAEEIPYDETRNYSKRVIASYFAYTFLDRGAVPEMPNVIPKKVLP